MDTVVCVGMDVMYVCKYAGAARPFLCRGSLTPHFLSHAGNQSDNPLSSHTVRPWKLRTIARLSLEP